jgi:hypothetical protein
LIGRVSQARLELEGIIILYCTPLKMSEWKVVVKQTLIVHVTQEVLTKESPLCWC